MMDWIAGATADAHGQLRDKLGARPGEPIPAGQLMRAEHSPDPKTAKQAQLAVTLRHLSKTGH